RGYRNGGCNADPGQQSFSVLHFDLTNKIFRIFTCNAHYEVSHRELKAKDVKRSIYSFDVVWEFPRPGMLRLSLRAPLPRRGSVGTFEGMDNSSREPFDSSRISDQPALRSASGTFWVVAGGLFLVVIAAVLAAIISSGGPAVGYAITTIAVVAALYLVLLIARFAIRPGKTRLWVMAGSMIGMAGVALIGLVVCVGAASAGA